MPAADGVEDRVRRFAAIYRGPWSAADALVWADDPSATTGSGAEPPAARVDALRRRVYGPGALPADAAAFADASDELERRRQEVREAVRAAGLDLRDHGAPDDPDRAKEAEAEAQAEGRAPSGAFRRPSRRRVLAAAGLTLLGAGGITAAAVASRPPDLGRLVRPSIAWRSFTGTPRLDAAVIAAPDLSARSAAVALLGVRPTDAERITAPRSPFYGRGWGSTDFDVRRFDIGVANVAVAVACDAPTLLTIELGVLAGVTRRVPQRAFRMTGRVPADRFVTATSPLAPFERPSVLRATSAPAAHYIVRAVFVGVPITP